jgi:hypothetical protein
MSGKNNANDTMMDDISRVFDLEDDGEESISSANEETSIEDESTNANADANAQVEDENGTSIEDSEDSLEDVPGVMNFKPKKTEDGKVYDNKGNLLADNPREKKLLFNNNRMRQVVDRQSVQLKDMQTKLFDMQKQLSDTQFVYGTLPQKLNLDNDTVIEAMQFRAKLDIDPVTTVREIVARVMQSGYTIEELFGNVEAAGFINTQMTERMLNERLAPITERFNAEKAANDRHEAAQNSFNEFVSEHPYADTQGELIAQLVDERQLTPQQAYYALREFATLNRLDFTKPIKPQLSKSKPQTQQTVARTMPNARASGNKPNVPMQQKSVASSGDSWRDIVKQAYRDNARS